MLVMFNDASIDFSEEEWKGLDKSQKMMDISEAQISLGKGSAAANPDVLSWIKEEDEPHSCSDQSVSEARQDSTSPGTGLPVITSVFSFCIKQEEEPYATEHPDSERREAPMMNSVAAGPERLLSIKQEDEPHGCSDQSFSEGKENNPRTSIDLLLIPSVFSVIIKEEEEPCAIERPDPAITSKGPKNKNKYSKKCLTNIGPNKVLPDKEKQIFGNAFHKSDGSRDCVRESVTKRAKKSFVEKRQDKWTVISKRGTTGCKTNLTKQIIYKHAKLFKTFTGKNSQPSKYTSKKTLICTECDKCFCKLSHLKRHQMSHTGEKPFKCSECHKNYRQKWSLIEHMKIHAGENLFKCSECDKSFTRKSTLLKHEMMHTGEKPFKCYKCGKGFNEQSTLRTHEIIHTGEKPFPCLKCEKCFHYKRSLRLHEMTHSIGKQFKCSECDKGFYQKSSLRRHEIIHLGEKPFKCSDCVQSFNQKSTLKQHKMIHMADKPFKCSECDKGFKRIAHLKRHEMIHTGEKPFNCSECEKCFSRLSHLSRHEMIHKGEKPFKCSECDKGFIEKSCFI
ncbi:zinc finger protein 98-like [Rhinatrema bivittatum]|uniref:zinc finger protein 98-like n=1 Tax=Rhinatrema bivittatum TaxID=194408 RepID=UPI0011267329|nr:zinc finger protein 98-like [Rhinatrema bivittatum]